MHELSSVRTNSYASADWIQCAQPVFAGLIIIREFMYCSCIARWNIERFELQRYLIELFEAQVIPELARDILALTIASLIYFAFT